MQTTLSVDEAAETADVLRRRFPLVSTSATDDICYATTNRQAAVQKVAEDCDLVIVVGSKNSSNSLRLVEVAQRAGTPAHLVDDATELRAGWLAGARRIGITAGASAPPHLVDEVIGTLQALGDVDVHTRVHTKEDITFTLPKGVSE
jgi:4-hydroxy-3-methylbut-2-enyl diphosphate reductase